jgi:hypothetical protein
MNSPIIGIRTYPFIYYSLSQKLVDRRRYCHGRDPFLFLSFQSKYDKRAEEIALEHIVCSHSMGIEVFPFSHWSMFEIYRHFTSRYSVIFYSSTDIFELVQLLIILLSE